MPNVRVLRVPLDRSTIRDLLAALAVVNVLLLTATFYYRDLGGLHWRLRFVLEQLNVALENNIGAWYSAMLLLAVSAAMLLCYALDRRAESLVPASRGSRMLTLGWVVLALVFMLLSLDELGSLHERIDDLPWLPDLLPELGGVRAWAAVLAIPIAVVAAGMLAFAWSRVRVSRTAALLLTGGVLLFLTVPVQEHFEAGMRAASGMGRNWPRPMIYAVLEEGAEMFGTLLFLAASLTYARHTWSLRSDPSGGDDVELRIRDAHVAILCGLLGTGLLAVHVLLPHLMYVEDGRGVPQNWFPSALACTAGVLCMMIARQAHPAVRWPMVALGALNLALSIDHGSDYNWRDEWLASGHAAADLVLSALALLVVAGVALLASRRLPERDTRIALWIWAALLALDVVSGDDTVRTLASTAGYIVLIPGLMFLLPNARGAK